MATTLSAWRTDVAAVVAAALGVVCQVGPTGNPEPNTALVQWQDPWLSYDPDDGATFCAPAVFGSVVIITSSNDLEQAQTDLDKFLPLLATIAGVALAGGGQCPSVLDVSAPSTLFEDSNLLAIRANLRPTTVTLA